MARRAFPVQAAEPDSALARAQAGEVAAFEEIVREFQAMVFSLAYHFLCEFSVAEDVAQDVFFDLSRGLARIESPMHLTFWLRKVTANRCIDRIRRRNPEECAVDVLPERAAADDRGDVLLETRIRRLVSELPPHARAVMLLRYQEDLDPSEIARVLDMPLNTVKSHLRRSVDIMRIKLAGTVTA
jgi:RNA polymerase sigma-70 factor, ECF subfamily